MNSCTGCKWLTWCDRGYEQYEEHYEYCLLHYLKNPERCVNYDIESIYDKRF